MLAPKDASGRFGQICSDATPRVSRKIRRTLNITAFASTVPIPVIIKYLMQSDVTD
jgi:hypothetical protein